MAAAFVGDRKIGSVKAAKGGATAAWNCQHKRIGTFVDESLAITVLMDIADRPLEEEPWIAWVEALIEESVDTENMQPASYTFFRMKLKRRARREAWEEKTGPESRIWTEGRASQRRLPPPARQGRWEGTTFKSGHRLR